MPLGMIGLGRMGADIVRRLQLAGHQCVAYDHDPAAATALAEIGYLHCGPVGAGHFVKMVHNGIEYALMAAYAEGLNILHNADVGKRKQTADAETAPLRNPGAYAYDIDVGKVSEVWRRGSVVASW